MSREHYRNARFNASDDRSGPFTWGQTALWDVLRWLPAGASLNIRAWLPLREETTIDDVVTAVTMVVCRHESLRTVFQEEAGECTQTVRGTGEVAVLVVELAGGDVATEAERTAERLRTQSFDVAADLAIRVAVLADGELARAVAITVSHLSVDGSSMRIVLEDLRCLLCEPTPLPPRSRQPIDRALFEQSPAGQRRQDRTLRFWADRLRRVAPATVRAAEPGKEREFEWARLESTDVARAAHTLSARTGLGASTVILAAAATVLAGIYDVPDIAVRLLIATRFQSEDKELVAAFNLNGLFHLDVGAMPFERLLRATGDAHLLSLRHCEADPRKLDALIADIGRERGFDLGDYCFFNDIRYEGQRGTEVGANATSARSPLPPSDITSGTKVVPFVSDSRQKGSKFFLYLRELTDRCDLMLCADREFASATEFLTALAGIVERAAVEPATTVADLRPAKAARMRA